MCILKKMTEPYSISKFLVKQNYNKDGRSDSQALGESCQLLSSGKKKKKKERRVFFRVN